VKYPTVTIRTDVLESWLKVCGCTKSHLADELGISKGRISQLLSTQAEPSAHLIAKLLTVTHLPFDRVFRVVRNNEVQASSSVSRTKKQVPTVEAQLTGGQSSS